MPGNRQQTSTWTNADPDLCRHMASPGHNELIPTRPQADFTFNSFICCIFSEKHMYFFHSLDYFYVYNYIPYPDGVYTPVWSVHSKATLLPLPLECTLQPHSEYHRCTLGCHSMDLVKSLTNRNTLQHHFKCTPDGVYTTLPLLWLSFCPCIHSNTTLWTLYICSQDSPTSMPLHAL